MRDLVLAWMWFSSARDVGVYVTFMSFSACRSTLFVCRTVATLCASNHSVFWSFRCVRNASCCATSRFCAMACVCLALWRYPFEFGVTRGSGCRAVFCLHTVSFVTWCTCFATWLRSRPNIAGLQCRPRWWNSGADVLHKPRDVNGCFLALCVRGDGVWLSIVHGVKWCSHSHLLWCAHCYFALFRPDNLVCSILFQAFRRRIGPFGAPTCYTRFRVARMFAKVLSVAVSSSEMLAHAAARRFFL